MMGSRWGRAAAQKLSSGAGGAQRPLSKMFGQLRSWSACLPGAHDVRARRCCLWSSGLWLAGSATAPPSRRAWRVSVQCHHPTCSVTIPITNGRLNMGTWQASKSTFGWGAGPAWGPGCRKPRWRHKPADGRAAALRACRSADLPRACGMCCERRGRGRAATCAGRVAVRAPGPRRATQAGGDDPGGVMRTVSCLFHAAA